MGGKTFNQVYNAKETSTGNKPLWGKFLPQNFRGENWGGVFFTKTPNPDSFPELEAFGGREFRAFGETPQNTELLGWS